jgi:hypothetical protein
MSEAHDQDEQRFPRDPEAPRGEPAGQHRPLDKNILGNILETLRAGGVNLLFEKTEDGKDETTPRVA